MLSPSAYNKTVTYLLVDVHRCRSARRSCAGGSRGFRPFDMRALGLRTAPQFTAGLARLCYGPVGAISDHCCKETAGLRGPLGRTADDGDRAGSSNLRGDQPVDMVEFRKRRGTRLHRPSCVVFPGSVHRRTDRASDSNHSDLLVVGSAASA